jgi:hypothetical protein
MMAYRLNMDCIDVTLLCDTEPKFMYAPNMPVIDTPNALLRYMARRRWGWRSRAARRRANRSEYK